MAASIATGTSVVTKSDAADLSAVSAAVAASAAAVALARALAKRSQTLARVCSSLYRGSSFSGSIHPSSGFVLSMAIIAIL